MFLYFFIFAVDFPSKSRLRKIIQQDVAKFYYDDDIAYSILVVFIDGTICDGKSSLIEELLIWTASHGYMASGVKEQGCAWNAHLQAVRSNLISSRNLSDTMPKTAEMHYNSFLYSLINAQALLKKSTIRRMVLFVDRSPFCLPLQFNHSACYNLLDLDSERVFYSFYYLDVPFAAKSLYCNVRENTFGVSTITLERHREMRDAMMWFYKLLDELSNVTTKYSPNFFARYVSDTQETDRCLFQSKDLRFGDKIHILSKCVALEILQRMVHSHFRTFLYVLRECCRFGDTCKPVVLHVEGTVGNGKSTFCRELFSLVQYFDYYWTVNLVMEPNTSWNGVLQKRAAPISFPKDYVPIKANQLMTEMGIGLMLQSFDILNSIPTNHLAPLLICERSPESILCLWNQKQIDRNLWDRIRQFNDPHNSVKIHLFLNTVVDLRPHDGVRSCLWRIARLTDIRFLCKLLGQFVTILNYVDDIISDESGLSARREEHIRSVVTKTRHFHREEDDDDEEISIAEESDVDDESSSSSSSASSTSTHHDVNSVGRTECQEI